MFFNKNLDQIRIEELDLLIHVNFNNPKKIPIKEIKMIIKFIFLQYCQNHKKKLDFFKINHYPIKNLPIKHQSF